MEIYFVVFVLSLERDSFLARLVCFLSSVGDGANESWGLRMV